MPPEETWPFPGNAEISSSVGFVVRSHRSVRSIGEGTKQASYMVLHTLKGLFPGESSQWASLGGINEPASVSGPCSVPTCQKNSIDDPLDQSCYWKVSDD
jgi:hypothetical protein